MNEDEINVNGAADQYAAIAEALFSYVRNMIYKPSDAVLDTESLPEAFADLGRGLEFLFTVISDTRALAKELAAGNLNCSLPPSNNDVAAPLKTLHSSLKHLTWQTQQVAKGDYSQRVDFMGDFSVAFNHMTEQLRRQRKISQDEKVKLETYVDLILESSTNPLLVFDGTHKLIYVSNSWFRYCSRFTMEQIVGKKIGEIMSPIVSDNDLAVINRSYGSAGLGQQVVEHELDMDIGYNGTVSHFRLQYTPMMNVEGHTDGIMVFLFDLTENERTRKEAERAREHAEESSRAKSAFLAKMSHEIRTPMNAIIGMSELALREEGTPATQEHLLTIKQAGMNLLSIINDILDFSKIETGKLELIPAAYLFPSLMNDVINIIKTRVLESRLRFIVNLDCNIPNMLIGDSSRIRQIMINLLGNAVKYTDAGFISVSIVREDVDESTINLIIEVSDSGRGIKEENLPTLFEEFSQFDKGNSAIEGTGLGLAITDSLVSAMNGHISCVSEFGKGSTFTAVIPQKYYDGEKLAVVIAPEEKNVLIYERREICIQSILSTMINLGVRHRLVATEDEFVEQLKSGEYSYVFVASTLYDRVKRKFSDYTSSADFVLIAEFGEAISDRDVSILTTPIFCLPVANYLNGVSDNFTSSLSKHAAARLTAPDATVLVVDDINTNLKVAEGLLQPYKMRVDLCKSGREAIEAAKETRYDLIFMDHMMPGMDGLEATAYIRALGETDAHYKSIPIIALTANAVSGTREMFISNGFSDFLSKPIDIYKLDAIIEHWIPKEKQNTAPVEEESSGGYSSENTAPAICIDGVNTKNGLLMTGGTIDKYMKMLHVFVKDGSIKLKELGNSLNSGDLSLFVTYVHGLKSASAIIGAETLSEDAYALEQAGKSEDMEYLRKFTPTLLSDLELLLENVNAAIAKAELDKNGAGLDTENLKNILNELAKALDEFDSSAINKGIDELQEYARSEEYGKTIESIISNKIIGEYDTAIAEINGLLWIIDNTRH